MKTRLLVCCFILLISSNVLRAQRYAVLPQLAVGDGWSFDVFITNESSTPANGVLLSFFDDNGALLPVNTNSGVLSSTTFNLEPSATRIVRATSNGPVQAGYALLRSPANSSIRSTLFVRFRSNTQVVTQLGLSQQVPFTQFSCAAEVDSTRGINTGMAFAFPVLDTAAPQDLVIQLVGVDGRIQRSKTLSLGGGQHTSLFLNEPKLFPGLDNFSGIVMVSAAKPFGFIALRLEQATLGTVAINASPVLGPFLVNAVATLELESNNTLQLAQTVPVPAKRLGRIESPTDVDLFRFSGGKGDLIALLVDTQELGSTLDPVLTLRDSGGSVVARNDQNGLLGQNDSFLQVVLPSDGTYYAEVASASSTVPTAASYHLHVSRGDANIAGPQITSFSPNTAAQGTTLGLLIQGSNLVGTSAVNFSPGSDVTVSNIQSVATQVSASVTIGLNAAIGARQISVTTPGGVSNALTFTVTGAPAPKIDEISPSSALQRDTLELTIYGSNLNGATAVNFAPPDGITVTNIAFSAGRLTASVSIAADAPPGSRAVTVVTPSGASNPLTFTVRPLASSIDSMTPSSLAQGSSAFLVIQGTNLQGALTILFDPATGISLRSLQSSPTQVTAVIKADFTAAVGTRQVKVWTPSSTPTGPTGFTNPLPLNITATSVTAPRVNTVRFESGLQGSTLNLTLAGSGLSGVTAVNLSPADGLAVSNIQATSSQVTLSLNIAADAPPGYRRLSVTGPAGESNSVSYFVVRRGTNPPVISNLNIGKPSNTTLNGQPAKSIDVSFDFTDPDADIVFTGTVNARATFINTTTGCTRTEANSPFIDKPAVTSGKISFAYVTTSFNPDTTTLTVRLTDASGNASNTLSAQPEGWICENLKLPRTDALATCAVPVIDSRLYDLPSIFFPPKVLRSLSAFNMISAPDARRTTPVKIGIEIKRASLRDASQKTKIGRGDDLDVGLKPTDLF